MPDVRVRRFSAPTKTFRMKDQDGNAIDITGYTIRFAAKRALTDPDSEKLFDISATLSDPTNGEYQLAFTRSQTSFLAGSYAAELRWWTTGGPPSTPSDYEASSFAIDEAVIQDES
jgi:hypothetical protein